MIRANSTHVPHTTAERFHTRSRIMRVGNGREGNGRGMENIIQRHLRNARAVDNSSHDVAAVVRDTATGGDAA